MRLTFLLVFLSAAACSGSGATVADSDSSEVQGAKKVAPPEDPSPVSPTTKFECKTGRAFYDGAIHSITFSLRGDDLAGDVTASPATSILAELGEDATTRHDGGRFVLDGANGDAELVLYDNSDLTKGYVVVEKNHADVFCTKTK